MTDRTKLIDKIVKILRLGDASSGTTEGEMLLAVQRARELMATHSIELAEVEAAKGEDLRTVLEERMTRGAAYTRRGSTLAIYDNILAVTVGALTDTEAFVARQSVPEAGRWTRLVSIAFFGTEEDVAVATTVFVPWLEQLRRRAREQMGTGWSSRHTNYAVGFATRLRERAQTVVELTPELQTKWGLVVAAKSQARERFRSELKKARVRTIEGGPAYQAGYRDGDDFSLDTTGLKGGVDEVDGNTRDETYSGGGGHGNRRDS
jgi:hypothetical protein